MKIENKDYIDFLINLKEDDITRTLVIETFGEFNGKKEHDIGEYFEVPIGAYGPDKNKNKNKFTTTLGLWFFNKLFIEQELFPVFKYMNESGINKKRLEWMNSQMSYAVLEDIIPIDAIKHFQLKLQVMMSCVSILAPNYSPNMLTATEKISKKKRELIEKNKEALQKEGNEIIAAKIEKELLDYAKNEVFNDDDSMSIYDSGAIASYGNNFKNMYIMKGAIMDTDPAKGFNVATSDYMEGISKDEYVIMANSLPGGPYSRAKKTEVGGYLEKLFMQGFQHVQLDKEGSDCETKRHITVELNNKNISDFMYSYIIEGSKLIELTSQNKDKYIGKTVKIRFSSLCESKTGICNKCMGNLYYRLGIKNVGMTTPKIATVLKNKSMKAFHDSSVRIFDINVNTAFGFE